MFAFPYQPWVTAMGFPDGDSGCQFRPPCDSDCGSASEALIPGIVRYEEYGFLDDFLRLLGPLDHFVRQKNA